jgi:ATPase subunit of ABC transporter with duplicated ATPase domains
MESKRKEYLTPHQEEIKSINETYKKYMNPIEEADQLIRSQIINYNREQDRIRREQEEINRKRLEAAEAEMKLKGELTEPTKVVEVIPEPAKTTRTDIGTASQRDNWKFEVIDIDKVPRKYLMPDTVLLNNIAKKHHDGYPIEGVRFYNEPIINVRSR